MSVEKKLERIPIRRFTAALHTTWTCTMVLEGFGLSFKVLPLETCRSFTLTYMHDSGLRSYAVVSGEGERNYAE
jgi:hypothetical protein